MDGVVDTFSYAEPTDPRLKRFIIRLIERMTGQPYLKSLYDIGANHGAIECIYDANCKAGLNLNIHRAVKH